MLLPPARQDGLGAGVGAISSPVAVTVLVFGLLPPLAAGAAVALTSSVLLLAIFIGISRLCMTQIGGQTGDVLGALQQSAEVVILVTASTIIGRST
ncbi:MAG: adenosylcobinamide-GDP ribazoletransferase [Rhizobiaceae bacterium]|jgi:adenosylcobinamide-GDP ribazoletransferase